MKNNIYGVRVIGNFYGGSYYEQGLDVIFVLAKSEFEAKGISRKYIEVVEDMFRNKRYINGKLAIAKKDRRRFKPEDIKSSYVTNNISFHKVLTKRGKFENINLNNLMEKDKN